MENSTWPKPDCFVFHDQDLDGMGKVQELQNVSGKLTGPEIEFLQRIRQKIHTITVSEYKRINSIFYDIFETDHEIPDAMPPMPDFLREEFTGIVPDDSIPF